MIGAINLAQVALLECLHGYSNFIIIKSSITAYFPINPIILSFPFISPFLAILSCSQLTQLLPLRQHSKASYQQHLYLYQFAHIQRARIMSKVKISYSFKGDMSIIQQQIDVAVKKAMKQVEDQQWDNSLGNFKQLRPIIERRFQQYLMSASTKFRNMVEYTKNQEKEVHRVIMEPDQNLQKINEVKTSMLKQSMLKSKHQKWPQLNQKVDVKSPSTLHLLHSDGFQNNIAHSFTKNFQAVSHLDQELQQIQNFEEAIVRAVSRLEIQQKYQSDFLSGK